MTDSNFCTVKIKAKQNRNISSEYGEIIAIGLKDFVNKRKIKHFKTNKTKHQHILTKEK